MKYQTLQTHWRTFFHFTVAAIPLAAFLWGFYQDWSNKLRPICKILQVLLSFLGWLGALLGYQWDLAQVITTFVRVHGHLDLLWQYITTTTL